MQNGVVIQSLVSSRGNMKTGKIKSSLTRLFAGLFLSPSLDSAWIRGTYKFTYDLHSVIGGPDESDQGWR